MDNTEKQNSPAGGKKITYWVLILGVLVVGGLTTYFLSKSMTSEKLPPPLEANKKYTENEVIFFNGLLNSVEKVAEAKAFLFQGHELYKNTNPGPAESVPAASDLPQAESAPSNKSHFLKASEQYVLALEYFKSAKQLLDQANVSGLDQSYESCMGGFEMAIQNFINSTSLFIDDTKGHYSGEDTAPGELKLPEARAKYVVAEDLMRENLSGGCEEKLFIYWQSSDEQKDRANLAIQKLYKDQPETLNKLREKISQAKKGS